MELSYKLESIQDSKIIIVVIETSYYFKCIGKQKREGEGEEGEKWKKLSSIKKNFIKLSVSPEPPIPVEYRSTEVENKISGSTDEFHVDLQYQNVLRTITLTVIEWGFSYKF